MLLYIGLFDNNTYTYYILYECKTCTTYSYHFKTTFIMYINFVDLIANKPIIMI